jgi:hypothetical protein
MAQPAGFPFTVAQGKAATLPKSAVNMLLTLRHIPFDCSAKTPKARSHSGYGWEGVLPDPVHPICDGTSCTVDVEDGEGGGYRVDAHVRLADETPTEAESAARLLLQGSFGACVVAPPQECRFT